jgi:tight adherence protein B
VLWSLRGRGDAQYEASVPAVLDDVAAELRAGSSLVVALGEAGLRSSGPLGADLRGLVEAVDRGGFFLDELTRWAERRPLPSVRLATAALAVGATTGGRQARAVESVGITLRERSAVRREAIGLATQSRASALVMAITPIVFAVAASTLDPPVGHVLAHTPLGIGCLAGGLVLEAVAALWMSRITGATP